MSLYDDLIRNRVNAWETSVPQADPIVPYVLVSGYSGTETRYCGGRSDSGLSRRYLTVVHTSPPKCETYMEEILAMVDDVVGSEGRYYVDWSACRPVMRDDTWKVEATGRNPFFAVLAVDIVRI